MILLRTLLSALLLLAFTPATAQITAVYANEASPNAVKVEVSASGDIRISGDGAEGGMLIVGDQVYLLNDGPDGRPEVMRAGDFAIANAEQFAKLPQPPSDIAMPALAFEKKGEVTVNGRKGTAYYLPFPGFDAATDPALVISTDPALAPLGVAMARQFEAALSILPPEGKRFYPFDAMLAILKTGTPLSFAGQSLVSVDRSPIPAERFALPAQPLTLEQVRARAAKSFVLPAMDASDDAKAVD